MHMILYILWKYTITTAPVTVTVNVSNIPDLLNSTNCCNRFKLNVDQLLNFYEEIVKSLYVASDAMYSFKCCPDAMNMHDIIKALCLK